MFRYFLLSLLCGAAFAQTRPSNPFDKPPADVDAALRSRVTEFYNLHMNGKYRQAEQLVAEDAKDIFYSAGKPDIKEFRIADVLYSDEYKKAKATILAKMPIPFMGAGVKVMDVPFPSYWKLDGDKWCWYVLDDPERMTPFGKINPKTGEMGKNSDGSAAFKPVDLSTIAGAVKADRLSIKMGSPEEKVRFTNSLPGVVTLGLSEKDFPGLIVTLDRTELKNGESAVLTVTPKPGGPKTRMIIGVLVKPTNQAISIEVK
jgi:hypothetical protein